MDHHVGEVYILDNGTNNRKYALIIEKKGDIKFIYNVVYLTEAKPYEYESVFYVGTPKLLPRPKKSKELILPVFKISSHPYELTDLSYFGKPVAIFDKKARKKLFGVLEIINDKDDFMFEKVRLTTIRNNLHKRLSELKKQKQINRLNSIDYSEIENEMDEISMLLGYSLIDQRSHYKQRFRETPSKYIKIYLGGRGG